MITRGAAVLRTATPLAVEPVSVTVEQLGCPSSAAPVSPPGPVTTLSTPGGSPASTSASAIRSAVNGVLLDGLRTMVFPPTSAGAIFRVTVAAGKFQGVIATTTPRGSHWSRRLSPEGRRETSSPARVRPNAA